MKRSWSRPCKIVSWCLLFSKRAFQNRLFYVAQHWHTLKSMSCSFMVFISRLVWGGGEGHVQIIRFFNRTVLIYLCAFRASLSGYICLGLSMGGGHRPNQIKKKEEILKS